MTDSRLYGNEYSVFDLLSGLTDGIFSVRDAGYDTMRQNLQVEYVRRLTKLLDSEADSSSDVAPQSAPSTIREDPRVIAGDYRRERGATGSSRIPAFIDRLALPNSK